MKSTAFLIAISLLASIPVHAAPAMQPSPAGLLVAPNAGAILRAADKRAAAFEDQSYDATMAIHTGGKLKKTLRFEMVMKGLDKQLIEFNAPGDVAGMKVLMQDADTLYVYSPEFKKVRRIAAHMQNQGFLGSTFTYEDMTRAQLSPHYDAEFAGKRGSQTTLRLSPEPGTDSTYDKLKVVIDAKRGGVTKIRYYDGSGKAVREQLRQDWKRIGGTPTPTKITMKDLKTGDFTVIRLSNIRVNQGVDDDKFSRRMLMRG